MLKTRSDAPRKTALHFLISYYPNSPMTVVQTTFVYAWQPDACKLRAVDQIREVYGVRQFTIDERAHMLQVEYDASRLTKDDLVALFRDAGIILWKLSVAP